ncbi:MAG: ATP-binding domain-containing protein, partial [Anaerolineae bacterium]|nr:ATP-binding domain-containing protein [Anaerolineae bacterium]
THLGGYISRLNGGLDKYDDDNEITLVLGLHAIGESEKYDAVFIDEAQDFRKEWIEMIFNKFIKGERNERNFLVATDDAQRIFPGRDFTWKSLNIPMRGHSKILKTIYRNSARVWAYSALLQGDVASYINERKGQLHFSLKSGFDPQFQLCKDMNAQIDEAINLIQKMIAGGYSPRNVLVLYRSKIAPHSNFAIVDELRNRLSLNHIPHTWITQNGHSKSSFDWEEDSVKISSIHSAKGMDSPVVIILGAETFVKGYYKDDEEIDEKRLMYVAMTRAQEFLMILGSGRKGLVPDLLRVEKEYQRFRPGIISLENGSDNQEDISPEEEDRETD